MIEVEVLVHSHDSQGRALKKQKVATVPELDAVSTDLFSVVQDMHSALHKIDRVDGLVSPLLKLDDPYL